MLPDSVPWEYPLGVGSEAGFTGTGDKGWTDIEPPGSRVVVGHPGAAYRAASRVPVRG
ncbi:hypothetical protein GCM10027080_15450 [Pedococcus soli]